MDYVFPFHIQANSVVYKGNMPTVIAGSLELHVVTGGPVYLFSGRKGVSEANSILTDPTVLHPEFEIAAVPAVMAETDISSSGLEYMTLYSTADSIGYLRVVERVEPRNPLDDLREAMEKLRTEGIRLYHDVPTDGPIPVDPGAPRLNPMRGHVSS